MLSPMEVKAGDDQWGSDWGAHFEEVRRIREEKRKIMIRVSS